jgi:hypothetical protein
MENNGFSPLDNTRMYDNGIFQIKDTNGQL